MKTPIRKFLLGSSAVVACVSATMVGASSHREAPGITEQPKVDATDFYVFRSYEPGREDYVTLIANYVPLQAPYGGPNYFTMDPDALYEIHIDNDGDAMEEITFQFQFDNSLVNGTGAQLNINGEMVAIPLRAAGGITADSPTANLGETEQYTVNVVRGDRRSGTAEALSAPGAGTTFTKPVDNIGNKTLPDYEQYANNYIYDDVTIPGCDGSAKVFVGQRSEAFAVNLGEIFDLVNLVPIQGEPSAEWPQYNVADPFPGGITQDRANDDLVGKANVTSLALEVPISCLTEGDDPVIGAWTTASLPQAELEDPSPTYEATSVYGGAWVQQSRLSNPLVNEVVIGLPDKDLFNAAEPTQDSALAVYVTNPTLPALINALFNPNGEFGTDNIAPSNFPRNDLVTAFLTGFPGLNQPADFDPANASEMMRLNTAVPPTLRANQSTFGVVGEDLAGFPNGRRPGDDTVDIALRVVMGRLCHDVPLGDELGADQDNINLGLCAPEDAPAGTVALTDGAPLSSMDLADSFPYLRTPIPGSPNN
ncbi:hypothetical protein FIU94_04725 [Sulfitobacter sp. THAF37]|uniref:DUF4331 domain-containing protein n=1 Tax=Sulfitobacter sp. THAF37 TaxID=2587855 RepID=UPI0012695D7C|nr:DUF4331 domain-containing protein [Sulfitobacter sp. THAF37]QFT58119.1 hypothetical protein FIU94_04725 [Sulfitobacter sp. THAF37]